MFNCIIINAMQEESWNTSKESMELIKLVLSFCYYHLILYKLIWQVIIIYNNNRNCYWCCLPLKEANIFLSAHKIFLAFADVPKSTNVL